MLFALMLAAAAPTVDAASLQALAEADARLVTIGRRLARGGAGLCAGTVSNPGWTIEDAEQYAPELRGDVRTALSLAARRRALASGRGTGSAPSAGRHCRRQRGVRRARARKRSNGR